MGKLRFSNDTTSLAAAKACRSKTGRAIVFAALKRRANGLTADQIACITGLSGDTIRPRLLELQEAGSVEKLDATRRTRANRDAHIYKARVR
jgi:predicted ArsR family transcriptional regulator